MKKYLIILAMFSLVACTKENPLPETKDPDWFNKPELVVSVLKKCQADPYLERNNENCDIALAKFHST